METVEDFVADSIAIDNAYLKGDLDEWLEAKRKQVMDDFRRSGQSGVVEGEASAPLDADSPSP